MKIVSPLFVFAALLTAPVSADTTSSRLVVHVSQENRSGSSCFLCLIVTLASHIASRYEGFVSGRIFHFFDGVYNHLHSMHTSLFCFKNQKLLIASEGRGID